MSFPRLAGAAVAAFTLASATAGAQIAPGSQLHISGTADATDIGTPGVILTFGKSVLASSTGNTGAFAFVNSGGKKPTSVKLADVRVGHGPQAVKNFLKVGGYTFDLAFLPSGPYGQDECYTFDIAVGQRCTPYQSVQGDPTTNVGLSPFYLENNYSGDPDAPINSVASFTLVGTVSGPGHARASFVGTISTAFIGLSYQEALYGLEQDGLTGIDFTGTFVTGPVIGGSTALVTAPEPSTVVLLAAGLAGAAGVARRRRRQSA